MSREWMWAFIAACIMATTIAVGERCNKGRASDDDWRKTKNSVERLDKNMDHLNEKCGIDPLQPGK